MFFKCKVFEESFKWIYVGDKRELPNSIVEGFNSLNRKGILFSRKIKETTPNKLYGNQGSL